jgi:carbonic anhydrase
VTQVLRPKQVTTPQQFQKLANHFSVAPSSEQQSPVSLLASCLPSGLMLAFEKSDDFS